MKRVLKSLFGRFGYEIKRKSVRRASLTEAPYPGRFPSAYQNAMLALLSLKEHIKIVQVGANDGAINDPIYDFVHRFRDRTRVLLIEPQKNLAGRLQENYMFHRNHTIFTGAIGPKGTLTIYSVKEPFWEHLSVPYAKDWPEFRAPTGRASTDREHVKEWLERYLDDTSKVDEAISVSSVPSIQLAALLNDVGWAEGIDVLQVDAEGADDQVIYNCNLERTRPKIIHFENSHLGEKRYQDLALFLEGLGYEISLQGRDALAIAVAAKEA